MPLNMSTPSAAAAAGVEQKALAKAIAEYLGARGLEEKIGRALSAQNEGKLKHARDLIDEVWRKSRPPQTKEMTDHAGKADRIPPARTVGRHGAPRRGRLELKKAEAGAQEDGTLTGLGALFNETHPTSSWQLMWDGDWMDTIAKGAFSRHPRRSRSPAARCRRCCCSTTRTAARRSALGRR
jgi:hypothetical protein